MLYNPAAAVDHYVSATRLSPQWFWDRGYWQGYSDCVMAMHVGRHKSFFRTRRVYRSVAGLVTHPSAVLSLLRHPDPARVQAQYKGRWLVGYLSASIRKDPGVRD